MQELIGQTLGQYRIVEQLGKGGMATVFKAYQPSLDRYVAIKVLPPYFAHEEGFGERFVREARAIARLDHPHILPIYDYGQEGEISYIVMKYVDAGTLKDAIGDQPMSLEQAADIVSQVAEALDYAHEQGVIHRDVKPANVLMDRGEWALLTDFGLAKIVGGSQHLTASGVGVGTPAYMAPEQGQGRPVDARADIYSLGIVLYEMLTGRVPYEAETPLAVVLKHVTEPLPLPRLVNPEIPEPVELVILKALAKDPDDRYQSAGEMAEALRHAVEETRAMEEDMAWAATTGLEPFPDEEVTELPPLIPVGPGEVEEGVALPSEDEEEEEEREGPRVSRVVYVLGAFLVLFLVAVGAWLLWGRGGKELPTPTALIAAVASPTPTPLLSSTPSSPVATLAVATSLPAQSFRVAIKTTEDTAQAARYLSQAMDAAVEVVTVTAEDEAVQLLKENKAEFALLSMVRYLSLRDGPLSLVPVAYVQPFFSGVVVVRDKEGVERVSELKGRRVAVPSWDDLGAIMGRAELLKMGVDVERDCELSFVAEHFSVEAEAEAVAALYTGDADAAIVSDWTLQMLNKHGSIAWRTVMRRGVSGMMLSWRVLAESPPTSIGVLVARPDVGDETRKRMRSAFESMDRSLCRTLTSYDGLRWTPDPLADNLAEALAAVGLQVEQIMKGVPPASPTVAAVRGRIAVLPAAGVVVKENSFARLISAEAKQVGEDLKVEMAVAETPGDGDPTDAALRFINDGYTVIVTVGWDDGQRIWSLAHEYPDVRFVAFGSRFKVPLPNLTGVVYRIGEGGFVAGALAGKATANGKVAILVPSGGGNEQMTRAFSKGVMGTCQDCEVVVVQVSASTDGAKVVSSLDQAGVDVVFNAAGAYGNSVIGDMSGEGAWAISLEWGGAALERKESNPRFLGAVIVRVSETAYRLIADAVSGKELQNVSLGFEEGALSFVLSPKTDHPRAQELDEYITGLLANLKAGRVTAD